MLKYIFNISLFFCLLTQAFGQEGKFLPTSLRAGVEVANFGYSLFKDNFDFWEVEGDIDFHRYLLVVDYGYTKFSQLYEPVINQQYGYFTYQSNGNYFRAGADVNFIKNETHHNVLALGLRYGWTTFKESSDYSTYNVIEHYSVWPEDTLHYSENNAKGRWLEMCASLKAQIFKQLYFGFTVRYKILPGVRKDGTFKTYYLPGFGKTINNNNWGLNYYISYRIPFRKQK